MLKKILKSKKKKNTNKKRRNFYLQFLNAGDIYFDVGANLGNRITPIINEDIKIVAVEPQPKCIKKLNHTFGKNIILVPKGLGAKKGKMTMFLSKAHTISTLSKDFIKATQKSGRFSKYKWNKEIEIEIDTLDNLIEIYGIPSFIKIDVEGFELEVLKGLTKPVKYISFEYTVPERIDSLINCIDRILEIGRNKKVLFNYSIGESMEWGSDKWLPNEDMKKFINSKEFINTDFGDIYASIY